MLSKVSIFIVMLCVITQIFEEKAWEKEDKVIAHDVNGYYIYLPSLFIHHDLSFGFLQCKSNNKEEVKYADRYWNLSTEEGVPVFKMTMGMAMMYSPFFLISHAYCHMTGQEALGFSREYKFALLLSCIFYLIIGYIFLMKVLKKYFQDWLTALVILCVGIATNLFYYSTTEAAMPHAYSFSLISVFLYLVHKWYEKPRLWNGIFLGVVMGLIVVVRPTNVVFVLFFLLFGISSLRHVKERLSFLWEQRKSVISAFLASLLVVLPQVIYWKVMTGHYIFNPHIGESFFFNDPEVMNALFSYRKGWFVYTPIMFLAMIGVGTIAFKNLKLFIPLFIVLILNTYLITSWWCWWYGGSFGNRAFIDLYPLMAIGLGYFFLSLYQLSKRWLLFPSLIMVVFMIKLNLFQSEQYRHTLIHWDSMTKEAYWEVFMTHEWPENYGALIEPPDYEAALKGEEEY